ncbi:MAG TPA: DUF1566 domain-containing protein [Epsilonproteobacteria bacterium]|nr:DUF1566 domain-containing protein [Campylobacterota bacterium]
MFDASGGKPISFKPIRDNDQNVVIDTHHNLMWNDNTESNTTTTTYQGALDHCESVTYGGYDDWRVPNIHELYSIVDITKPLEAFFDEFVYTAKKSYWSSTNRVNTDPQKIYTIDFETGGHDDKSLTDTTNNVRCVRDITP